MVHSHLDFREAGIFSFNAEDVEKKRVAAARRNFRAIDKTIEHDPRVGQAMSGGTARS